MSCHKRIINLSSTSLKTIKPIVLSFVMGNEADNRRPFVLFQVTSPPSLVFPLFKKGW